MDRPIFIILIIGKLFAIVCSNKEQQIDNIKLTLRSDQWDVPNNDDPAIETAAAASLEVLECPSTNIVRVKYKCPGPSNSWADCVKSQCCPGYNLINGKCIPRHINPCSLKLCEQQCAFIFQRIVCTCWDGFRFTAENGKRSNQSMCIDIDECKEGIHDCQQICENTHGSFACACENGFILRNDNKTCMPITNGLNNDDDRCLANCHTVEQLQKKTSRLQEKLAALEIATSLLIHGTAQNPTRHGATGPPGPPGSSGPQGSPGMPGSRADPSPGDLHHTSTAYTDEVASNNAHSILDSFIQTNVGYCKCQRGPIGPQGPPGTPGKKGATGDRGPRGAKGATGNLDFLLLILADIRHDVMLLQERIFPGEILSKFDFEAVLKKQRSIGYTKMDENNQGDDMENFQASEALRMPDYTSEEKFFESSGDKWDHYDE